MIHFILIPLGYTLVIIFIILLCFAWHYRNPYKLIMVFGKKGSGKTTLITKLTFKYLGKGIPVYSTVPVPGAYLFDVNQIGFSQFPEGCVIFIDEVGMIWDNRNFKQFRTEVRDYFKLQRHYKNTVYLFSQSFDIDLKLRNLTDNMYLTRTYFNVISVARRIDRFPCIVHPGAVDEGKLADDMRFAPLLAFWLKPVIITWIPAWVKFFDSFDVPPLGKLKSVYCEFPEDLEQRTFKYKAKQWMLQRLPCLSAVETGDVGTRIPSESTQSEELLLIDLDLDDDLDFDDIDD